MVNLIIFGVYTLVLLTVFGFLTIFAVHIRAFRQYSRYLTPVFRVYMLIILLVSIFGGYMILTSKAPMAPKNTRAETIDF